MALCSLSTGNNVAPERSTAAIIRSPAETRASLLASATVRPCSMAAIVGGSPAQPTIEAMVQSTSRCAAATSASAPAAASVRVPASADLSAGYASSSATTARSASNSCASAASFAALPLAVSATTRNESRCWRTRSSVERPTEPVAPKIEMERVMAGLSSVISRQARRSCTKRRPDRPPGQEGHHGQESDYPSP